MQQLTWWGNGSFISKLCLLLSVSNFRQRCCWLCHHSYVCTSHFGLSCADSNCLHSNMCRVRPYSLYLMQGMSSRPALLTYSRPSLSGTSLSFKDKAADEAVDDTVKADKGAVQQAV